MGNFKKPSFGGDRKKSYGDKPHFDRGNKKFDKKRPDNDRPLFKAKCSDCGKFCEVPFRPSGDKPVLCSECFKPSREFNSPRTNDFRREQRPSTVNTESLVFQLDKLKKQLENIERKLDILLSGSAVPKVAFKESSDELKQVLEQVAKENTAKDTKVKVKKAKTIKKASVKETKKKKVAAKTTKKVSKKK